MYKNIKPATITAIREYWKLGYWNGNDKHKKETFDNLLRKLCEIYKIQKIPYIKIDTRLKKYGCYIPSLNIIIMKKYSLITFLHEFKHAKDYFDGKKCKENNAIGWSLSLMYQVNPRYFFRIVKKGIVAYISEVDIQEEIENLSKITNCPYCFEQIKTIAQFCPICGADLL